MQRTSLIHSLLAAIAVVSFLSGCTGTDGRPLVTLTSSLTPTYNGAATSNVDAFQNICTAGTNSGQYEYMADHNLVSTFTGSLVNPSVKSATVTIDRYRVDYQNLSDSPTAPPIQSYSADLNLSFTVTDAGQAQTDATLVFVDLVRKSQYASDLLSGVYGSSANWLNNYTATYTFECHDQLGTDFTISASQNFEIGDFDSCQ